MSKKKIIPNSEATRFSSERQPKNRGRKPSVLKHLKKDMSIQDIRIAVLNAFGKTVAENKKIATSEKEIILARATAVLSGKSIADPKILLELLRVMNIQIDVKGDFSDKTEEDFRNIFMNGK